MKTAKIQLTAERAIAQIAAHADAHGDPEAVSQLAQIAGAAIMRLDFLLGRESDRPTPQGRKAAQTAASESRMWPAYLSAHKDQRDQELKAFAEIGVGTALGYRIEGKNRGFDSEQVTGWVEGLLRDAKLNRDFPPKLTRSTLAEHVQLCMEQLKSEREDLARGPWPQFVTNAANQQTDEHGHLRGIEAALRLKIRAGLKPLILRD